jgi:hypothetical protein
MDHAPALGQGRLGRPDIQPAIDLARVTRQDLDRQAVVGQAEGQLDGEPGLTGRRGAAQDDQWRPARLITG